MFSIIFGQYDADDPVLLQSVIVQSESIDESAPPIRIELQINATMDDFREKE